MYKILTVLKGTVLKWGNTPNWMTITPLYLLETHFFNWVTVLTELITEYCVTVLTPIYRRSLTQLTHSVDLEELYV